jgi:hypothetical protein
MKPTLLMLLVAFCLLFIGFTTQPQSAKTLSPWKLIDSPWPTHAHDFQRTNRSSYTGIEDGVHIEWMKPFGTVSSQSLTVGSDGLIYGKSLDTYAFSPEGELIRKDLPGGACYSTPTHLANDTIYYATTFQWIGAHTNGDVFWAASFSNGCFHFTPAVTQDGIGYFLFFNYIHAIDLTTHELLWIYEMGGWTSMALGHDDTLYVSGFYGALEAVRPDGSLKWHRLDFFDTGHQYRSSVMAIGDDGTIYVSRFKDANLDGNADDNRDSVRALDSDGNVLWDYTFDPSLWSCGFAVAESGTLYVATGQMNFDNNTVTLYAITSDGNLKWSKTVPTSYACGGPVTDNAENVYLCARNGHCYGFTESGDMLWDIFVNGDGWMDTYPLIYDDKRMYVATDGGIAALAEGDPVYFYLFLPSISKNP